MTSFTSVINLCFKFCLPNVLAVYCFCKDKTFLSFNFNVKGEPQPLSLSNEITQFYFCFSFFHVFLSIDIVNASPPKQKNSRLEESVFCNIDLSVLALE